MSTIMMDDFTNLPRLHNLKDAMPQDVEGPRRRIIWIPSGGSSPATVALRGCTWGGIARHLRSGFLALRDLYQVSICFVHCRYRGQRNVFLPLGNSGVMFSVSLAMSRCNLCVQSFAVAITGFVLHTHYSHVRLKMEMGDEIYII